LFASVISHVSAPYNPMLSIIVLYSIFLVFFCTFYWIIIGNYKNVFDRLMTQIFTKIICVNWNNMFLLRTTQKT
jgi:hypothetical protein